MKTKLIDIYLDFLNNFLTVKGMAEHYNIDIEDLVELLQIGKKYFENNFKNT